MANWANRRIGAAQLRDKKIMSFIKSYKDLDVYKNAMEVAMTIFERTKSFLSEERYSLTDQIRRSSRSICTNLAEAWRKRRYKAAFIAKLSDAETEAAETQVWAEFAFRCQYLRKEISLQIEDECDKIIGQIIKMMDQPEKWLIRPRGEIE